jgi:hypothetical protein
VHPFTDADAAANAAGGALAAGLPDEHAAVANKVAITSSGTPLGCKLLAPFILSG